MLFRFRFFTLLAVVLVMVVACDRPQRGTCSGGEVQLVERKTLTVGTDLDVPPFGFEDPKSDKPTGFEVELLGAIAKDLRLKLGFVNRTSAVLIPGLLAHRHDLDASGFVDTPEFRDEVCISSGYLAADFGLATRTGNESVKGVGDLEARVVGVVRGGRAQLWAHEHLGRTTRVTPFETSGDLVDAVRAGQIDAGLDDLPVMQYALRDAQDVSIAEDVSTGQHYVFAGHPSNGALMFRVNQAIQKLEINGTLADLKAKWFGS